MRLFADRPSLCPRTDPADPAQLPRSEETGAFRVVGPRTQDEIRGGHKLWGTLNSREQMEGGCRGGVGAWGALGDGPEGGQGMRGAWGGVGHEEAPTSISKTNYTLHVHATCSLLNLNKKTKTKTKIPHKNKRIKQNKKTKAKQKKSFR